VGGFPDDLGADRIVNPCHALMLDLTIATIAGAGIVDTGKNELMRADARVRLSEREIAAVARA
jgi:hypothetical protein